MGYKRKFFNDKTIVIAGAIGVMAVSAVIGGMMLNSDNDKSDNMSIVELDEEKTTNLKLEADEDNSGGGRTETEEKDDNSILNGTDESDEDIKTADSEKNDNINNDETDETELKQNESENDISDEDIENANASDGILGLNFSTSSILVWPVEGNVIIDFDMENTVYFATLDLYKCSDAVYIQAAVDTPVYAGSSCSIESIEYNSEIGNNVTVSMGNGYMMTYGQLKDIQVEAGDVIEEGELIGYVGSPTKYFSIEGSHLYMKLTKDGMPVDPLDFLNYN